MPNTQQPERRRSGRTALGRDSNNQASPPQPMAPQGESEESGRPVPPEQQSPYGPGPDEESTND